MYTTLNTKLEGLQTIFQEDEQLFPLQECIGKTYPIFCLFDNIIDFDLASIHWQKNKKKKKKKNVGKGSFDICNFIHTKTGKRCRRSLVAIKLQNSYIYGFGGCTFHDKYKNHPNKNYFCKRHINRIKL
jgi:hypothetical protein